MRFLYCVFPVLLLTLSCTKDEPLFTIHNLNGDTVTAIGHAGMGTAYRYPGDTYESLSAAMEEGVHGVEMDIRMASDSTLVLFHHTKLEEVTTCSGDVADHTWTELQDCSYNEKITRPKLITASGFLTSDVGRSVKIFVWDVKQSDTSKIYSEQYGAVLLRTLNDLGVKNKCLLESSNFYLLSYLSTHDSALRLFVYADDVTAALEMLERVPITGVTIDMAKISGADVDLLHAHGLQVSLFNARTERLNSQALLLNPDYIQTDRVEHLVTLLNKY